MKYSFCETLMWFALAKPSFKYLKQKGITVSKKKAKKIYRQMTERTPDIGGLIENPLRICLSGGMVWLSIYEAVNGTMADACFGEMVITSMNSPLIVSSFKKKAKTAFTIEGQKKKADSAKKTNALAKDDPFQWNMEVIYGRDESEYTINYHQCGLCALGKQEGLSHLVPYMCDLDIISVEWMGGVLYRTKTLATGGDCCDFYICKKGSEWHKQRENENDL